MKTKEFYIAVKAYHENKGNAFIIVCPEGANLVEKLQIRDTLIAAKIFRTQEAAIQQTREWAKEFHAAGCYAWDK